MIAADVYTDLLFDKNVVTLKKDIASGCRLQRRLMDVHAGFVQ
jgi:hypothetical protein